VVYVPESEAATRRPPKADVYVLDVRGKDHLPAYVAQLTRDISTLGFVLLTTALDPGLMLEAMRAGIRECVAEPLESAELEAAIARVSAERSSRGDVFAFVGAKGGVGTTTAAVNVALELSAVAPKKTLLVDLHMSNGDAAVFLAEEPRFTVADAIENAHRLDESVLRTLVLRSKNRLDLLASPDSGPGGVADVARIRMLLDFAARNYRYTILDVPRSEPAALDALQAASKIVVVANQELATIRSASRMAATLRHHYGKDRLALALTRYDPNAEIGENHVQGAVGLKARYLVPSDYRRAIEALNSGNPLSMGNHNRLSASFKSMAYDLAGLKAEEETESRARLFGRFKGKK
jgi:pilus assembly protein CpaE